MLSQSPKQSTETLDADNLKKKCYLKLKAQITLMLFNLFQSLGEEGWRGMKPLKFLLWTHRNIDGQTPPKRAKTNFILIKQNPETDTKTQWKGVWPPCYGGIWFHPKGNQSWIFTGRTDADAETPKLWPPDAKSWLIWKDPDAGKDWR